MLRRASALCCLCLHTVSRGREEDVAVKGREAACIDGPTMRVVAEGQRRREEIPRLGLCRVDVLHLHLLVPRDARVPLDLLL